MKNYNRHPKQTDSKHLLDWLSADSGAEMVDNYEDFCKLAAALNKGEYNISKPPSEKEFKLQLDKYIKQLDEYRTRRRRLFSGKKTKSAYDDPEHAATVSCDKREIQGSGESKLVFQAF